MARTQIDYLGGGTSRAAGHGERGLPYVWIGPVAGYWNATANSDDVTAGQNPAALAPGANDLVTIGAAAHGAAQVVIGNGNAQSLTIQGETLLEGQFTIGAGGLTVAQGASAVLYAGSSLAVSGNATFDTEATLTLNGGTMSVAGTFYGGYVYSGYNVIENGGSLTAGALAGSGSLYSVSAGGALTVKGNVAIISGSAYYVSGSTFTVKGTFVSSTTSSTRRTARRSSSRRCEKNVNGISVTLSADATSSIEIGATGGTAAGTITIDAGKTVTEAGSFYAPTIVDKGALKVGAGQSLYDYGTLEVDGSVVIGAGAKLAQAGALTGSGKVTIGAGSSLGVSSDLNGSAVQIAFSGAGGTLGLDTSDLNASNVFAPTVADTGSSDVIDFTDYGATITGAHYASGELDLYAGSTVVATLNIGSGFKDLFSTLPIGNYYTTQIDYLGGGTKPAPPGTANPNSCRVDRPGGGKLERDGELGRCDGGAESRSARARRERSGDHRGRGERGGAGRRRQRQRALADA